MRPETIKYYKLKRKPLSKHWKDFKKRYANLIKALAK